MGWGGGDSGLTRKLASFDRKEEQVKVEGEDISTQYCRKDRSGDRWTAGQGKDRWKPSHHFGESCSSFLFHGHCDFVTLDTHICTH